MWRFVVYALALGTSAFAQRAPVPGGGAALGPAAAPLGVRQNKRKYISLFGNVEIADETTFIYEFDYIDYTGEDVSYEEERPCGTTQFFVDSFREDNVFIRASRSEVLRPECTGGDEEPGDYGFFDYNFFCAQAEVPKADAVTFSEDADEGILQFSDVELQECDYYGDYGNSDDNPFIGRTVSADATVSCPVKDISIQSCQFFDSNPKRVTFSSFFDFQAQCSASMVPTFTFDGMDYKFNNLEFGFNVEKNFRDVQRNKNPRMEVSAHMGDNGPLPIAPTGNGTVDGGDDGNGGKKKSGHNKKKKGH